MGNKVDLVEIIERLYEPAGDCTTWQERTARVMRPLLDPAGMGVGAYRFDVRNPARPQLTDLFLEGKIIDPVVTNSEAAPNVIEHLYDGAVASSLSDRGLLHAPQVKKYVRAIGFQDIVSVRVDDEPFVGWIVFAPRRKVIRVAGAEKAALERIARHIATARRLVAKSVDTETADAVIAPSGKVEHATGIAREREAREALATAARRVDKARGALRRLAPNEAIAEWRALADGRWSLVDHFDHDGRRYLVAVRNEARGRNVRALSKRESEVCTLVAMGHANKLIAYELGLSTPTVAGYVASSMRKLGVQTRVELVARWNAVPRRKTASA